MKIKTVLGILIPIDLAPETRTINNTTLLNTPAGRIGINSKFFVTNEIKPEKKNAYRPTK